MHKSKLKKQNIFSGNIAMFLLEMALALILVINFMFIVRPSAIVLGGTLFVYTSAYSSLSALSYPIYLLMFLFFCDAFLKNNKGKVFAGIFTVISFATIAMSFVLELLERIKYPNYVYSSLHVYLPALVGFSYVQLAIFLCGFYFLFQTKYFSWFRPGEVLSRDNIVRLFLIIVVYSALVTMPSFVSDEYIQQRNNYSMRNIDIKYRTTDLPQLSKQLLFVRDNTPNDAVIVHPPQSVEFPDVGNQVLLRYYLYPRVLVTYKDLSQYISDNSNTNCKMYTLVARAGNDKSVIFPMTKKLEINEMTLLDYNGTISKLKSGVFDGNSLVKNNFLIGVLENKKCSLF